MDFFKACTTNVYLIDNLQHTRYRFYRPKTEPVEETDTWTLVQTTLSRLRELNVLCADGQQGIYVFDDFGEEAQEILQAFEKIEEDTLEAKDKEPVKELFLSSIEGALAFSLAKTSSTLHIAPWTWICYETGDDETEELQGSAVKVLRKLTPSGALYLVPEIRRVDWVPVSTDNAVAGTQVLLAPHGRLANVLAAPTKDTICGTSWKDAIAVGIQPQGLRLEDEAKWIVVQDVAADDPPLSFMWPEILCLSLSPASGQETAIADESNWQYWFEIGTQQTAHRNPLAEAEEWFRDAEEFGLHRSGTAAAEDYAATQANGNPSTEHNTDNMTSPPFSQRMMDHQAAMAGIYPTPPDGLTQGGSGVQFNTAATPTVAQGDQGAIGADTLASSDDVHFPDYEHKPSIGAESYHMTGEDLFGDDAAEMEIGDNEVDDADFNFFDDDDDMAANVLPEDVDMMDQSMLGMDQPVTNGKPEEPPQRDVEPNTHDFSSISAEPGHQAEREGSLDPEETPDEPKETMKSDPAKVAPESHASQLEKPLSPFGIRERLLPPPVPASVAQSDLKGESENRRTSLFGPIVFRDNLELGPKYSDAVARKDRHSSDPGYVDIGLPLSSKRSFKGNHQTVQTHEYEEESDDDSSEVSSSDVDGELPPRTPWDMPDNRKRKRFPEADAMSPSNLSQALPDAEPENASQRQASGHDILETLSRLRDAGTPCFAEHQSNSHQTPSLVGLPPPNSRSVRPILDIFDISAEDVVYIAQIVNEQAATAIDTADVESALSDATAAEQTSESVSSVRRTVTTALEDVFPEFDTCELTTLALTREPVQPARSLTNSGKGPQQPPRPPQRADSMAPGPEIFSLPAPYVKIQRGKDSWEMLPTCLPFWETLGLAPASGPKHIRAFCVFPDNNDLQQILERFMADMGTAYEGCKLGTHVHHRNASAKDTLDNFEDGMAPVELSDEVSLEAALRSYANTCSTLGKALASISHRESERSIVVYMVNPFRGHHAAQHLCACFWMLWKAYRENLHKVHRSSTNSDIVLQLLSIDFLASEDTLVVQDAKQMATLARELYDRCPPSSSAQAAEDTSALQILAAPSVELASSAPKRIGFQLSAEPPSDLLHEGSILHLAYALSSDGEWLTAAWIDTTGRYQDSLSLCLRGRSFADAAEEVWERTREIMAARKVTWRIFISTHQDLDASISQCWRSLCGKPRAQAQCVTMATIQIEPVLQLLLPTEANPNVQEFLTPASTPQGSNNLTNSPDVGQTPTANAPLTPGPSEAAASLAENDPDAHLVDITDETFALLYHPKLIDLARNAGIANGALFKRGDAEAIPDTNLPGLGVSIHWTVQVKPDGKWDEGSPKQAELTLREVLRMYRHLGLLTKARGLARSGQEVVPVHVEVARRGAEKLNGMLSPVS